LYDDGKCASCGGWIDDPKEHKKKSRYKLSEENLQSGECDCVSPEIHFSGICQICRKLIKFDELNVPTSENFNTNLNAFSDHDVQEVLHNGADPAERMCRNCGTQLVTGYKFCPNCGNEALVESKPSAIRGVESGKTNAIDNANTSNKPGGAKTSPLTKTIRTGVLALILSLAAIFVIENYERSSTSVDPETPGGRWVENCVTKEQPRTTNLVTTCTTEWVQD
jgi:uncharacterized Zn finger protein (UPF0148 family)